MIHDASAVPRGLRQTLPSFPPFSSLSPFIPPSFSLSDFSLPLRGPTPPYSPLPHASPRLLGASLLAPLSLHLSQVPSGQWRAGFIALITPQRSRPARSSSSPPPSPALISRPPLSLLFAALPPSLPPPFPLPTGRSRCTYIIWQVLSAAERLVPPPFLIAPRPFRSLRTQALRLLAANRCCRWWLLADGKVKLFFCFFNDVR